MLLTFAGCQLLADTKGRAYVREAFAGRSAAHNSKQPNAAAQLLAFLLLQASAPAVVLLPEVDDRFELPSTAKKQESAPVDAESEKQRVRYRTWFSVLFAAAPEMSVCR